ncbi:hypothetical protein PR048_032024 [Dryococelus australis]|uniref:FERM domain-containing protein n=1 Tax=Dryococelus australis TaxID=614101 RepID=A0ABQ9G6Y1_9NEOP|nr:hypothetical protein PR048_032024 [Dryococelus australis]
MLLSRLLHEKAQECERFDGSPSLRYKCFWPCIRGSQDLYCVLQLLRSYKLEYKHKPLQYEVTFMYAPHGPLRFKVTLR